MTGRRKDGLRFFALGTLYRNRTPIICYLLNNKVHGIIFNLIPFLSNKTAHYNLSFKAKSNNINDIHFSSQYIRQLRH